jgi:hypothetical protein
MVYLTGQSSGRWRSCWSILLFCIAMPAMSSNPYVDEPGSAPFNFDESLVEPWMEQETTIPDPPELDSLHELRADGLPPGFRLFLDIDRITVDPEDGIIRLWMMLRSSAGHENISYEGYRCITGEYRVYAYANLQRDPPVRALTRSTWRKARGERSTYYRKELLRHYLCGLRGARPPIEIQQAVRRGELRDPLLFD